MASDTWSPILKTGLSDVIGSWKTMAMSSPRTLRISFSDSFARSLPLKRISPPVTRPGGATRRMIDIAVTLLPQPDSPTSAAADVEGDVVDRAHRAVAGEKRGLEVLHLEDGLARIDIAIGNRGSGKAHR